jgi:hypothetical protein
VSINESCTQRGPHVPWAFCCQPGCVQESAFLLSSIAMLLAGMVFTSRGFAPGSTGYLLLTIVAATLIILSVGVFLALLCFEVYRSIKVRKLECGWHEACECSLNLKFMLQVGSAMKTNQIVPVFSVLVQVLHPLHLPLKLTPLHSTGRKTT